MPICIIPARAGSKRLPAKNILPFKEKPLLHHVIETALATKVFEEVIVSSESDEFLEVAIIAGAKPFKRKQKLATDTATVVDVCADVLQSVSCTEFCCLYATSVLLKPQTLKASCNMFLQNKTTMGSDVLMGVSEYNYNPVQALEITSNGFARLFVENYRGMQSQTYPEFRVSNGSFYWADKDSFLKNRSFYSPYLTTFDVPVNEVCDIDTHADYEALLKQENTYL